MQVSGHGLVGQFCVECHTGDVDLIIDAVGQVHGEFALHRGRMWVNPFALRMYVACYHHVCTVLEERTRIHLLDIHHHIIGLIVNVVESIQGGPIAAIIGLA